MWQADKSSEHTPRVPGAQLNHQATMHNQWQSILERIWPSRSGPSASQGHRMTLLQATIAMAIALAAGPDVILAMEMTTLLEMLGASLFLSAFAAGARLTAMRLWRTICDIALPEPQLTVIRSDVAVPAKAQALIYCVVHAAWWLMGILILGAWAHSIIEVAI
jgi:hypothetical protein